MFFSNISTYCSSADIVQLSSLLTPEAATERLDHGITLLHQCCSFLPLDTDIAQDSTTNDDSIEEVTETFVLRIPKDKIAERESPTDMLSLKHRDFNNSPVQHTKTKLAQVLICKGGDPSLISHNGFSPLHLACYKVFMGEVEQQCTNIPIK